MRSSRALLGFDAQCCTFARASLHVRALVPCKGARMTRVRCVLSKRLASPLPSCGAPNLMDCHDLPRLAFGHLDQDLEDEILFDMLLAVIPGDQQCSEKLTEQPAQHPKTPTALACSLPEGQMTNAGGAPSMRLPLRDT